ncbi:P-loop containing nucleoside triphosphate hydrolase protein, partial [Mycena sanguinolenta]
LPPSPQIFNGREFELETVINSLLITPARVAILGPGGMGKTTLAIAALHNYKVVDKYSTRHFISCDSVDTRDSLIARLAIHLGLETSHRSTKHIIHHLSTGPPSLVIFDNFETPWEPVDGRAKVEDFLSLLTDIPHLAILVTMRGAERPSKVKWTHPFLNPLIPLSTIAARQTVVDIADDIFYESEVDRLLEITGNIPLVVQLVATVAATEGCQETLYRWKLERTALLSAGYDKRSNLEASIMLSLSGPRMLSVPQAIDLLSLMSVLPDGVSDLDLVQSKPPILDVLKCKMTLVRTSLAYLDPTGRLKVLVPIREYIHTVQPPTPLLVRPLRNHFKDLLELCLKVMTRSSVTSDMMPHLLPNLGNFNNTLLYGLDYDYADLPET